MTEHHAPGAPEAELVADQLADLLVVDGPNAGQVWTYDASKGGYVHASARGRVADDAICADVGALLVHVGAEVVRPMKEER